MMVMIPRAREIETHLRDRYGDGAVYETRRVIPEMAAHFQLTREELAETDGSHLRFEHKVHTALARHCKLKLLVRPERGSFKYLPEKLASFEPRHHPPRAPKAANSSDRSLRRCEDDIMHEALVQQIKKQLEFLQDERYGYSALHVYVAGVADPWIFGPDDEFDWDNAGAGFLIVREDPNSWYNAGVPENVIRLAAIVGTQLVCE
jgi:hypothetical protein